MRHLTSLSDRLLGLVAPKITAAATQSCSNLGDCWSGGINTECCCVGLPGGPGVICTTK
jgi:hypothetical protein